ncbi:MAG TPA: multidrug ABC transporter ATP-binding protein [Cytophagales bacterium]|nr:multidrug ABC transporter ATP-binding protein [Cytophagales bacterium]
MEALEIRGLSKTYPNGVQALNDVSLTIPNGMYGLLGPNGAGKSSLMRTIATLQAPDAGTVAWNGKNLLEDPEALRAMLGYLPQEFGVYPKISAYDLLNHLAILKGYTNARERKDAVLGLLQRVNLYEVRKKAVSSYSGGMRQRFGIAQALLGDPQLIIVDEPTAGLDPGERNRFYNLLAEIGEQVVVILSTHIVEDVRELCSQMAILNHGKVLYEGTPQAAMERLQGQVWQKQVKKEQLPAMQEEFQILTSKLVAGVPLVHVFSETNPGEGFQPVDTGLEDVFFTYIKADKAA